jgi:hypothetical protein
MLPDLWERGGSLFMGLIVQSGCADNTKGVISGRSTSGYLKLRLFAGIQKRPLKCQKLRCAFCGRAGH